LLLCGLLAQSANARGRVLARQRVTVAGGGDVDAASGWNLYVPPHTVKRNGYGSITALARGRVAIAIGVPWHGSVEVTGPLRKSTEVVAHDVGGIWVPEGNSLGQRTVWVTQLSPFSISGILGGIQDALCLSIFDGDVPGFIECLAEKGLSWLNSEIISWVFSKVSNTCVSSLIADGISTSGGKGVSIAVLKGALKGASCTATASSPGVGSTGSSGPVITDPIPTPVSPTPLPTLPAPPEQPLEPLEPVPTAPTQAPTYPETPGPNGVATFTDYLDEGGEGPRIPEYETVQVECRVEGYEPADHGIPDNWYYRIASYPWDGAYYAYAEPFYNDGQTSGSLSGTPPVDTSVPLC
jgi:hypothetical protein